MKKFLLGTSALLVAGFIAGTANAAPVKLNVGGYANWYTGFVDGNKNFDNGNGYNHMPVVSDIELAFSGETALANGLKFGAVVELDTDSDKAEEDQSFVYVESAFGKAVIGKMDSISVQMHTGAKDVGMLGLQDSDVGLFINSYDGLSTDIRNGLHKQKGISYISPKAYGFTFAATYTDLVGSGGKGAYVSGIDATNPSAPTLEMGDYVDNRGDAAYAAVVAYDGKFGAFGVAADAGYARIDNGTARDTEDKAGSDAMNIGAAVSYEGFTFGAAFKYEKEDTKAGLLAEKGKTFDVGVAYEQGPYGVSLSYIYGKDKNEGNTRGNETTTDLLLLSGSYEITAGVDTFASFGYTTSEAKKVSGVKTEEKAYVVATGLGLTF
ncbi:MAG: hypothetical protein BWY78_00418 [Alphaproteobacteria bacterium ADurb.Bin438]|nr:MAG: hypothetical protein BWY78_00418 [Alphaproteobacteria bacterium ADurb.Bin438]